MGPHPAEPRDPDQPPAPGGPPSQDPDDLWRDAMLDDLHDADDDDPLNLGFGLDDDPPPPPHPPSGTSRPAGR